MRVLSGGAGPEGRNRKGGPRYVLWMANLRIMLLLVLAALPFVGGCAQRLAVEGRSERLYAEAKGALESEGFRPVGRGSDMLGAKGSDPSAGRLQFLYYADNLAPTIVEVQIEPGSAVLVRNAPVSGGATKGAGATEVASSDAAANGTWGNATSDDEVRAGAMRGSRSCAVRAPAPPDLLAAVPGTGDGASAGGSSNGAPVESALAEQKAAAVTASAAGATSADAGAPGGSGAAGASDGAAPAKLAHKRYAPGLIGAHRVVVTAWSSMTYAPDPFIADLAVGVLRRAYMLSGNVR